MTKGEQRNADIKGRNYKNTKTVHKRNNESTSILVQNDKGYRLLRPYLGLGLGLGTRGRELRLYTQQVLDIMSPFVAGRW